MSNTGNVVAICIAPPHSKKGGRNLMRSINDVRAIGGHGLEGDRYCTGEGSYSTGVGHRQVTFINANAIPHPFVATDTRRNIVVSPHVDLMWLLGRYFWVGDALFYGVAYCDPCRIPTHEAIDRLQVSASQRKTIAGR